jgi:hypothetical protein
VVTRRSGSTSSPRRRSAAHSGSGSAVSSGRQRRQARKPARVASSALGKNVMFSRRGFRAGQPGRQKTPVVETPTTKSPS